MGGAGTEGSRRAGPLRLGKQGAPGPDAALKPKSPTGILTLTALQKYPTVLDSAYRPRPQDAPWTFP